MRRQIGSELRKLTSTRSAYWLLAGLLGLTAVGTVGALFGGVPAEDLARPLQGQGFLLFPMTTATVFTMILGIRSFTDEFRHGSIVPTLLASPERRRVLGAKVLAVGGAAVVFAVGAMAVSMASGVAGLMVKGIDVAWSVGPLALMTGRLVLASVLWSTIGVGLGLAVRHQVAAIVGALVWGMIAESAIAAFLPDLAKYLPGSASSAIVGVNADALLAPGMAVAVLAGWATVASVAGERLMHRRDVT